MIDSKVEKRIPRNAAQIIAVVLLLITPGASSYIVASNLFPGHWFLILLMAGVNYFIVALLYDGTRLRSSDEKVRFWIFWILAILLPLLPGIIGFWVLFTQLPGHWFLGLVTIILVYLFTFGGVYFVNYHELLIDKKSAALQWNSASILPPNMLSNMSAHSVFVMESEFSEDSRIGKIYVLLADGRPFYVGQTIQSLDQRLASHMNNPTNPRIAQYLRRANKPEIMLLGEYPPNLLDKMEQAWIRRLNIWGTLLNTRIVDDLTIWIFDSPSEYDTLREIQDYRFTGKKMMLDGKAKDINQLDETIIEFLCNTEDAYAKYLSHFG